jgi:hypothetical protein
MVALLVEPFLFAIVIDAMTVGPFTATRGVLNVCRDDARRRDKELLRASGASLYRRDRNDGRLPVKSRV